MAAGTDGPRFTLHNKTGGEYLIGVISIDGVVLGGDQDDVVSCAANCDVTHIERLGEYLAIYRKDAEGSETTRSHVAGSELGLLQIGVGTPQAIICGKYVDLRRTDGRHRKTDHVRYDG